MCVYISKNIAECQSGYYGKDCTDICSVNCLHDYICDRFTGQCKYGCKSGWTGGRCNQRKTKVLYLFNQEFNKLLLQQAMWPVKGALQQRMNTGMDREEMFSNKTFFTFLLNSRTSVLIKQKRATAVVQCSFCCYF